MKRTKIFNSKGFTLLELMIAVAILGVLASIAIPKYMNYRDKAVAASCLTNRHYIDMEEQSYYIENDESSLQIDDKWSCPAGGQYVWIVSDPDNPRYPEVGCSMHYTGLDEDDDQIEGLVASWDMDEGQGSTLGEGDFAGTIYGAQWTDDPERGSVLSFDGKDDYVEVPDSDSLDLTDEVTLSVWAKPVDNNKTAKILQKGDWDGYSVYQDKWRGWKGAVTMEDGSGYNLDWNDKLPDSNQWYHLVTTYDGSQKNFM